MKIESSGFSANSILKQPECFANLLKFYDGICQWEEGSATPVLHIGWAKPLVNTISKFDAVIRAQVNIICEDAAQVDEKKENLVCAKKCLLLNNNYCKEEESNCSSKKDNNSSSEESERSFFNLHPSIEALTAGCSEKILNPEYLLQGDGCPFVGTQ